MFSVARGGGIKSLLDKKKNKTKKQHTILITVRDAVVGQHVTGKTVRVKPQTRKHESTSILAVSLCSELKQLAHNNNANTLIISRHSV